MVVMDNGSGKGSINGAQQCNGSAHWGYCNKFFNGTQLAGQVNGLRKSPLAPNQGR